MLIASRDHLCVNQAINMQKGFSLNAACKSMQRGINPCIYYRNKDHHQEALKDWPILDIEDLHKVSKNKLFCPYYAMKERVSGADVIFMPYNYLVDEKIRENFEIEFENSIMIFDEAHNITSTCEEQSSFVVDTKTLEKVLQELQELKDIIRINKERELKSKEQDIDHIKFLSSNFL